MAALAPTAPAAASGKDAEPAVRRDVVTFDYDELLGPTTDAIKEKIGKAFGYDGLGILAVRGVPGLAAEREACLPFTRKFGLLPDAVKAKYVHPDSFYSFGWSHGKEKFAGTFDVSKGSYYFNPVHDRPVDDPALIRDQPAFCHPNIWPTGDDCPGMEDACKTLTRHMVQVGTLVARHCDAYVASIDPTYPAHRLQETIEKCRTHKARLLYYFATDASNADGNWCGWHNDHGSLTALTSAMYFDAEGRVVPCPDPNAGLYIRGRHGETVRVAVPADCLAFQIGETSQVHSGGVLQATPHYVRSPDVPGVSRGTMAVFMEPEWDTRMDMPSGAQSERVLRGARNELLPPGMPALVDRWTLAGTQTFGEFTKKTLEAYY